MDDDLKKVVWNIFSVGAFLFVTIFFILPYLVQISTYFHERGHLKALERYGIEGTYEMNLLETIPNFFYPSRTKLGATTFDMDKYLELSKVQRTELHIAGIVSDLRFLFLIAIYLSLMNIYLFYKSRVKHEINFMWVLAIDWILFMWLIALVQITVANITHFSGDIYQLVRFMHI